MRTQSCLPHVPIQKQNLLAHGKNYKRWSLIQPWILISAGLCQSPTGFWALPSDFFLSTPRLLTIDFSTSSSSASSYFKYLEIRLSASENTPRYAIILRDLQKAASLYSILTANRHIYLLIVETVHMATNTMPSTCPSMATRPRTTRPLGSYITWSDVIRSNRSPSSVIRRLRTHPLRLQSLPVTVSFFPLPILHAHSLGMVQSAVPFPNPLRSIQPALRHKVLLELARSRLAASTIVHATTTSPKPVTLTHLISLIYLPSLTAPLTPHPLTTPPPPPLHPPLTSSPLTSTHPLILAPLTSPLLMFPLL